jgi:hypothetical protein
MVVLAVCVGRRSSESAEVDRRRLSPMSGEWDRGESERGWQEVWRGWRSGAETD